MEFQDKRRQQFLGETYFSFQLNDCDEGIRNIETIAIDAEKKRDLSYAADRRSFQAFLHLARLCLRYTAGENIESLRKELEAVVAAYERYGELLWKLRRNRNEVVFEFTSIDDYGLLMQLVGLCVLLHRRDLLIRVAAFQDGESGANGGVDAIYEELMAYATKPEDRYETEHACHLRPYESLFYALTEMGPTAQLKELNLFLKRWYKDLENTWWHDSHKPGRGGDVGGYYGYWSFEAGAAVLLLGLEDDSSLHKYLYYPKDLVAWSREHAKTILA